MKTDLYNYLLKDCICDPASIDWIDKDSITDPQVAWDTCQNGAALLWIATKHLGKPGWPNLQEIVLAACDCAGMALPLVPDTENRPRVAVETARRWAEGKATLEECREASSAAADACYRVEDPCVSDAAYTASDAARGASDAAHSAACASCAVDAPEFVSNAVDSAAYAIERSGGDRKKALADMADLVRKRLYPGKIKMWK
jgi:hypothetical protein